jgi:PAS domain S-box-containing protein
MRFTYSNHKAAEFIGYAAKDVLGKTLAELMPHSELSVIGQLMDDLMNAPKPFHDSKREISHKDGSSRTFMTNGIPIYNHNDEFNGYRGNCIVILPESTGIPQDAKDET